MESARKLVRTAVDYGSGEMAFSDRKFEAVVDELIDKGLTFEQYDIIALADR